jgi:radical SAM protein with 4Fe4S-binding SPASM domain
MNKETFCHYPFSTIFLGADGAVKTCCSAVNDLGNLNDDPINDILNGKKARSVRKAIIKGKWHQQCSNCKKLEDMGARSERSVDLEDTYDEYNTKDLTPEYFDLKKLDLRWTNICNLACNYCYEYFSSIWANIKGIKVNELKESNMYSLFSLIEENAENITSVNLLGGEPFLQKQNNKLIEILPNTEYYILTNLALDISKNNLAQRIAQMTNVSMGVSFETISDRFEYVRHNAKWDQFLKNIEYLKENSKMKAINAHPLYCTYSAFNLIEYYDFITNSDFFDGVYWCSIQNIDALNVFKLSKELRILAIEEIEKVELKYNGAAGVSHLTNIKQELIDTLNNEIPLVNIESFNQETETVLPKAEGKSFDSLWPELVKYIDKS